MARKSSVYWRERALLRERQAARRGAALQVRIFETYRKALRDIQKDVAHFYTRYASEQGLTYEEAMKRLSRREMQEWRADLGSYVRRMNAEADPKIKARLKAELDALSYNSQISRLQALEGQISLILNDAHTAGVQQMREALGENFAQSYYHKVYDLQSRAGFINEFAKVDRAMLENVLSYPWSGAHFSERMWQNKQALLFNMEETLTQGLIQGKSVPAMSQELAGRMGQSYKATERLIRTEINHFHSEADKVAYRAAGVKEYEFMATLDSRTSEVCGGLDGKHFPLAEAETGVNFPPVHPNCRSTTVEYDPDDAMDWYNSGAEMPERMTYEQWKREQRIDVEESGSDESDLLNVGASPLVVDREEMHQFTDGTAASSPAYLRMATIYKNADGVDFVWQKGYDSKKQVISPEQAIRVFDELPANLRTKVKSVEFLDYPNPKDAYWAKTYHIKGFRSFATGGDWRINFFANADMDASNVADNNILTTYAHEIAHSLDRALNPAGSRRFSESAEYAQLVDADEVLSGIRYVSSYSRAARSMVEDFAESVAQMVGDEAAFEKLFPNRARYLKGVL